MFNNKGGGEDHESCLPIIELALMNLLYLCLELSNPLIIRSDGINANQGIPDQLKLYLNNKFPSGKMMNKYNKNIRLKYLMIKV